MRYQAATPAIVTAPALVPVVSAASPAWAANSGWQGSSLTVPQILTLFAATPIALFALIALVVTLLHARRNRRTQNQPADAASVHRDDHHDNPDTGQDSS